MTTWRRRIKGRGGVVIHGDIVKVDHRGLAEAVIHAEGPDAAAGVGKVVILVSIKPMELELVVAHLHRGEQTQHIAVMARGAADIAQRIPQQTQRDVVEGIAAHETIAAGIAGRGGALLLPAEAEEQRTRGPSDSEAAVFMN